MSDRVAGESGSMSRYALSIVYVIEALSSSGAALLALGIFFYTEHYFHWTSRQNLLLATAEGLAYATGSMLATPLARMLRPRRQLILLHLLLLGTAGTAIYWTASPLVVVALVVFYNVCVSATWPLLESLISRGAAPGALSRRVGLFNITWSGVNALTVALSGSIIQWNPQGIFLVPVMLQVLCLGLILTTRRLDQLKDQPAHCIPPEAELLRSRHLALWLSRIAMPSVFIVTYSLGAILPSLPALSGLGAGSKTLIASAWMAARWLTFVLMSLWTVWHTRPRLLLVASAMLLVGFLGVVIPPTGASIGLTLLSMILGQLVLGTAMGMIQFTSLYFGMVLSAGSTEHGSYHEALAGVGKASGPAIAAAVQLLRPGSLNLSIGAIAGMASLFFVAANMANLRFARRNSTVGIPVQDAPLYE